MLYIYHIQSNHLLKNYLQYIHFTIIDHLTNMTKIIIMIIIMIQILFDQYTHLSHFLKLQAKKVNFHYKQYFI